MRDINKIIIHCSATVEGRDYTVSDINIWHIKRGFDCIGYHFVIYRDGTIVKGRALEKIGAHCKGYNKNSIGICYIGGLDAYRRAKDTRTNEQKKALDNLIETLTQDYPNATVHGHNEFANKECPCFDVKSEYMEYNIKAALNNEG